jgi:hypothetical protein
MLTFNPKQVTKELLADLPERSRKVLSDRFGLSGKGEERTLDAIGKEYGITRERVRQIEGHGLSAIRESEAYEVYAESLQGLKKVLENLGSVISEEHFLEDVTGNSAERRHVAFLLTVGHHFKNRREDANFRSRWHTDEALADSVERALTTLHKAIEDDKLTPEEEFIQLFAKFLKEEQVKNKQPEAMVRWLKLSKRLGRNPLGEWGKADSPHVRIKNTRDFAYLTLKRHGSPMHFVEVAKTIEKLFKRKTHPATTHNELIKDGRFVLVGRGLYALKEWGYEPGVVRDVIRAIIAREGPLSREDIVERVKRERYVKDATIAVNLQSGTFQRLPDGRYALSK